MGVEGSKRLKSKKSKAEPQEQVEQVKFPQRSESADKEPEVGETQIQLNNIFKYITRLDIINKTFIISNIPEKSTKNEENPLSLFHSDVLTSTPLPMTITSKEIYAPEKTIKDIILLNENILVSCSDTLIQIWNFTDVDQPIPIELKIPMICERYTEHNYIYSLQKLSRDKFAFSLKKDKTIIFCYLDKNLRGNCFVLKNHYDIVGMILVGDWTLFTFSRDGSIQGWEVLLQKKMKTLKGPPNSIISFVYKLAPEEILMSDFKNKKTFIINVMKGQIISTIDLDTREAIKKSNRQYLLIGQNKYVYYDILTHKKEKDILNPNNDLGQETIHYCGVSEDKYICYSMTNGGLFLKRLINSPDNTAAMIKCPENLSHIRVIEDTDNKYNPAIVLFYSRKFYVLDGKLRESGLYKEQSYYFEYMFSFNDKLYYISKEDRNINFNKGIFFIEYNTGSVLTKLDNEECKFTQLSDKENLALCGIDKIKIFSCKDFSEVTVYTHIFGDKDELVDFVELKDKILVFNQNKVKIYSIGEDFEIVDESSVLKFEKPIRQVVVLSENKVVVFCDKQLIVINCSIYTKEKTIETDIPFNVCIPYDIKVFSNDIIALFNNGNIEFWDLKKYEKIEDISKVDPIKDKEGKDIEKNTFIYQAVVDKRLKTVIAVYNFKTNSVDQVVYINDIMTQKWRYIDETKAYIYGKQYFYMINLN